MNEQKSLPTRILAIDYGMVRIGLAISDERKMIGTSMETMVADKKSEQTVAKLVAIVEKHVAEYRYKILEIVIGYPLLMNGKKGLLADEVIHFSELLKSAFDVPVVMWDERLTSVQADRSLRESNFSRKKRSQKVDSVAALIILQNYLDFKSRSIME